VEIADNWPVVLGDSDIGACANIAIVVNGNDIGITSTVSVFANREFESEVGGVEIGNNYLTGAVNSNGRADADIAVTVYFFDNGGSLSCLDFVGNEDDGAEQDNGQEKEDNA
ncbi:MAG: hypothetical protein GWN30_20350, partial [Gammaproteobacteria bacterium]|nr:hypothetical protein [Phycisphaerae bacterium]NIW47009.1 hypothetical protein [Gammaproteobacteria bacterium]